MGGRRQNLLSVWVSDVSLLFKSLLPHCNFWVAKVNNTVKTLVLLF